MNGTVKWFNATKGYGFIVPSGGGKDVFVHIKTIHAAGMRNLQEGQHIEFELGEDRGKQMAINLHVPRPDQGSPKGG